MDNPSANVYRYNGDFEGGTWQQFIESGRLAKYTTDQALIEGEML